jgi:hypothetical protein
MSIPELNGKTSQLFNIGDTFVIKSSIKELTTNNEEIVDISITHDKKFFKNKKIYTLRFIKNGSGFIKITKKDNTVLLFGIFVSNKPSKHKMSIGMLDEYHIKSKEFWKENSSFSKRRVDIIYNYFDVSNYLDIFYFLIHSKEIGCQAVLIYDNSNTEISIIKSIKNIIEKASCILPVIFILQNDENILEIKDILGKICKVIRSMKIPVLNLYKTNLIEDKLSTPILEDANEGNDDLVAIDASQIVSFNNDDWITFIFFISKIKKSNVSVILYGISIGKLNNSLDISPITNTFYNNHSNYSCDFETSNVLFIFGGKVSTNNIDPYFLKNECCDTFFKVDENEVSFGNHIDMLFNNGIKYLLLGSNKKNATRAYYSKFTGYKCTDEFFTISKINA